MPTNHKTTKAYYTSMLGFLIKEAEADGIVLSIETVPVPPLAMGNHRMVGSVRAARHPKPEFDLESACTEAMIRIGVFINARTIVAKTATAIDFTRLGIAQRQRQNRMQEDWKPRCGFSVFSVRGVPA